MTHALDAARTEAAIAEVMRTDSGRLLAALIGQLRDFQLAEDSLQDALESALLHWRRSGMPQSPAAWLMQVARRKALDRLRRAANFRSKEGEVAALMELDAAASASDDLGMVDSGIPDERLRLMFTCCHPALDEPSRLALTLRTLGGLTTPEIARAFVVSEPAMAQRLVRARHKIAKAGIPYAVPGPQDWPERLDAVLTVLYLIFNEGYASAGAAYIRAGLCEEAIRLTRVLMDLRRDEPEVEGLLALLLLHHARRLARVGGDGVMVPLEEQDRTLWDEEATKSGLALVEIALRRGQPGPFQIQAAISAVHAEAETAAATDWPQIALLYRELTRHRDNPVYELNRIAALAQVRGPAAALAMLEPLRPLLGAYQPLLALEADLLRRCGRRAEARHAYAAAINATHSPADRQFLEQRRSALSSDEPPR